MKNFAFLCFFLMATRLFGQFDHGFHVPDFTLPDINGRVWNLYEILDQGKSVILDFSGTNCAACWEHHQKGIPKALYKLYGPYGTDELMVFMIETQSITTLANLHGEGTLTFGNFVEGTPFPIIDHYLLNTMYHLEYVPEFFMVCPNKMAYRMGWLTLAEWQSRIGACPAPTRGNDGVIQEWRGTRTEVCPGNTTVPKIAFLNYGSNPITSAEIELKQDGQVIEILSWSGNLGTFELTEMAFSPIFPVENKTSRLDFTILKINGEADLHTENNTFSHGLKSAPVIYTDLLTIQVHLEKWAAESYWEITNTGKGELVAFGGNEEVGPNGGSQVTTPELLPMGEHAYSPFLNQIIQVPVRENGCYQFHLVDAIHSDFSLELGAFVKLMNGEETLLHAGAGNWNSDVFKTMKINALTTVSTFEGMRNFAAYPNPASEILRIDFLLEAAQDLSITLSNALGEVVYHQDAKVFPAGKNELSVATAKFSAGTYFLCLANGKRELVRKIIVAHP